jgi:hypothetical protein
VGQSRVQIAAVRRWGSPGLQWASPAPDGAPSPFRKSTEMERDLRRCCRSADPTLPICAVPIPLGIGVGDAASKVARANTKMGREPDRTPAHHRERTDGEIMHCAKAADSFRGTKRNEWETRS